MTSPRQRKKRLALLERKKKLENSANTVQKPSVPVAKTGASVLESVAKLKKLTTKNALVETKSAEETKVVETQKPQDQVVEQPKEEVKPSKGE
jgi:hypothetical protein